MSKTSLLSSVETTINQALSRISWFKEPTEILDDSNPPFYKWFKDGELNLSYNLLQHQINPLLPSIP